MVVKLVYDWLDVEGQDMEVCLRVGVGVWEESGRIGVAVGAI